MEHISENQKFTKNLVNTKEVAALLRITKPTLYKYMREDSTFPKSIKISPRKTYFRIEDIRKWILSKINK